MTMKEKEILKIDKQINIRGVPVNMDICVAGYHAGKEAAGRAERWLREHLGTMDWEKPDDSYIHELIYMKTGRSGFSLDSRFRKQLEREVDRDPEILEALRQRDIYASNAAETFYSLISSTGQDGRIRGAFHPRATISGRWTSGGDKANLHNLPHSLKDNLDQARELLKAGKTPELFARFPELTEAQVLSGLARTAIEAPAGKTLLLCDFSQIEARIMAWLAGDENKLNLFQAGKDLYAETARQVGSNNRTLGKILNLSCQYGGKRAVLSFAPSYGLELTEAQAGRLVDKWRAANPQIVNFWREAWTAVQDTIQDGKNKVIPHCNIHIKYFRNERSLKIRLPSDRIIVYENIEVKDSNTIYTEGNRLWYGQVCNHITQGVGADILAEALAKAEAEGLSPIGHVHDELLCEVESATAEQDLQRLKEIMETPPSWAELPLAVNGIVSQYYRSF